MTLERLEEYLDGTLPAEQAREVERAAAGDPVVAARLDRIKAQRALRAAALSTYMPSADETRAVEMRTMAMCYAQETGVAGRIGWTWTKRFGAVAAMLVIAAGSFFVGRSTGTTSVAVDSNPKAEQRWVVVVDRKGAEPEEHIFPTAAEAQDYASGLQAQESNEQPATDDGTMLSGVL